MKNLLDTVRLLLVSLFAGTQQVLHPMSSRARQYLRGLLRLAQIAILVPLPFAVIGIVTGWLWLTACAGLWCTAFLAILFLWGAPLGILIDSLLPGKTDGVWLSISGARYVSATRGILLWEALTYWVLSIVPIRNNWSIVPLCALSVVCLILMAYQWQRNSSWTKPLFWYSAVIAVIGCTIAFIFPEILKIWKWAEPRLPKGNETLTLVLILTGVGILVGIIVWLLQKAGRTGGTATTSTAHPPASAHGSGGGESSGSGLKAFAWIALLGLLVFLAVRGGAVGTGQQTVATQTVDRSFRIFANSGNPISKFIGQGTNICWTVEGSGHIMYRFDNEPWKEDWSGQMIRLPNCNRDRTVQIMAKGEEIVPVRIYLTPSGR